MRRKWTPEQRKKQSEDIHRYKPWEKSTGPRTQEGKAISSQNAFKGGWRDQLREFARILREHKQVLGEIRTRPKIGIK